MKFSGSLSLVWNMFDMIDKERPNKNTYRIHLLQSKLRWRRLGHGLVAWRHVAKSQLYQDCNCMLLFCFDVLLHRFVVVIILSTLDIINGGICVCACYCVISFLFVFVLYVFLYIFLYICIFCTVYSSIHIMFWSMVVL